MQYRSIMNYAIAMALIAYVAYLARGEGKSALERIKKEEIKLGNFNHTDHGIQFFIHGTVLAAFVSAVLYLLCFYMTPLHATLLDRCNNLYDRSDWTIYVTAEMGDLDKTIENVHKEIEKLKFAKIVQNAIHHPRTSSKVIPSIIPVTQASPPAANNNQSDVLQSLPASVYPDIVSKPRVAANTKIRGEHDAWPGLR
jgi:hypothetical protein